jgi:hypothetical protein
MLLLRFELLSFLFLPGFLAAFLIGWQRSRHRRSLMKLLAISTAIGLGGAAWMAGLRAGLFFYLMRTVVADHSSPALTVAEAQSAGLPMALPPEAHDVRFVQASGGLQAYELLVRFEASAGICRQSFIAAHPGAKLVDLESAPAKARPDMVGTAPWFDVQNIRHGWMDTTLDHEEVWIDSDRGIYYCRITD